MMKLKAVNLIKQIQTIIIFSPIGTLPQVFFKHFASKNQRRGLFINGTLVENGLTLTRNIDTSVV